DPGQSVADLVELERLDDGHDDFHWVEPPLGPALRVQGYGQSRLRIPVRNVASLSNTAATNQAPCQFAPSAVSAWKQKALAGGRVLAATFCRAPHKSGSGLLNFYFWAPTVGGSKGRTGWLQVGGCMH